MKQWHYAIFLIFLIIIILVWGLYFSSRNNKVENKSCERIEELYNYVKRYIGNGIYDYSFDKFNFDSIFLENNKLIVEGQCKIADFLLFVVKNNLFYPVGFDYNRTVAEEICKGSIGMFQRRFGMLTDYVESLEVITSTGIHQCSRESNPKLFWAIRGAGAENFGIITKITFVLTQMPSQIQYFNLNFPASVGEQLIKMITNNQINSKNFVARISLEKFSVNMKGLYFGPPRRLIRILNSIPESWSGDTYSVNYLEALNLVEEYSENNYHLKNYYIPSMFSEDQIKILYNALNNIEGNFSIQFWMLSKDKLSTNSMNRGKNAIILKYEWKDEEEVDWQLDQMIALTQRLNLSSRNKCCLGLFDYQLRSYRAAYFGKRHKQLRVVKKMYDPHHVFEPLFSL